MRVFFLLLCFFILCVVPSYSDVNTAAWVQAISVGPVGFSGSVEQTSDGGFITAGARSDGNQLDALIIRITASGSLQWAKTYGGDMDDYASTIIQTRDGGFIFVGGTESFGAGRNDAWVVKLDAKGKTLWQKTYGTSWIESARDIVEASDGSFFVVGNYQRYGTGGGWDTWCMKLKPSGVASWRKTYHSTHDQSVTKASLTKDGGLIFVGQDSWLPWSAKINSSGKIVWQKHYSPRVNEQEQGAATTINTTEDGGFVLGGFMRTSWEENPYGWTAKIDSNGNLSWQTSFSSSDYVFVTGVRQEKDGHILVMGTNGFNDLIILNQGLNPLQQQSDGDSWSARLDSTGTMFWQNTFGKASYDYVAAIHETSDDGTVFVGYRRNASATDALIARSSPEGTVCNGFQKPKKVSSHAISMTADSSNVPTVKNSFVTRSIQAKEIAISATRINLCTSKVTMP